MRKPDFTMTPEDLDRYDYDRTGDDGLRCALTPPYLRPWKFPAQEPTENSSENPSKPDQPSQTDQPNPFSCK